MEADGMTREEMTMSELFATIRDRSKYYESDMVRFLCDLIRTPSFSCKEQDVIGVIAKEMTVVGIEKIRVDGLGSIIGTLGNGPHLIAFDAHVDTVYAGDRSQWFFDPFTPKIEDGKVWGRGAVDQKSGLASMVYAAKLIKELNLNSAFTILFTGTVIEEDCDGLCWQYLIQEEKIHPELVIITEPTNMNLYRGQRGRMEIRVDAKGRSCHGSAPERGDNAIYKTARIALEIEKLNERLPADLFLGKGTITVTEIRSSSPSLCAVADGSDLHLDRRLTWGETKESAVAEVRDAAARAGYPDAEVTVLKFEEPAYTGRIYPIEKYYPTWILPENSEFMVTAKETYQLLFDKQPLIDKWTFSTNAVGIAGKHGIPCLGLGPGDEIYAHAPNEACPIEQITDAASFYAALVARLNGR